MTPEDFLLALAACLVVPGVPGMGLGMRASVAPAWARAVRAYASVPSTRSYITG